MNSDERTDQGFHDLAMSRRSVRVYTGEPVPRETTRRLIDLASHAPSNFNRQPWQFIVADEPRWCQAILGVLKRHLERAGREDKSGELFHMLDHVRTWLYPLESSPVLILAFYKPSPELLDQRISSVLGAGDVSHYNPNLLSLGMALQNLLLAAHASGLSACMHSGPLPFLRGSINQLLGLPAKLQLAGVVSLGRPAEQPAPPPHRDLDRVLTFLDGELPAAWHAPASGGT